MNAGGSGGGVPAFQVGKPVLAHVEMARDRARWGELAVFPIFHQ